LLFRRSIVETAAAIAPFMLPGGEAYPVITDGRVVWMLDLLSVTERFPRSTSTRDEGSLRGYNAARDSVKMTMDAGTGAVAFYAATEKNTSDPLLAPWRRALPELIQPQQAMPVALRAHKRYPPVLFAAQRSALLAQDSSALALPGAVAENAAPVYVLWPDLRAQHGYGSFVVQVPLWQSGPANGWREVMLLAAHCDDDRYGELRVLRFTGGNVPQRAYRRGLERSAPTEPGTTGTALSSVTSGLSRQPVLIPLWLDDAPDGRAGGARLLSVTAQYAKHAGAPRLKRVVIGDALDAKGPLGVGASAEDAWRTFWSTQLLRGSADREPPLREAAARALSSHDRSQQALARGDWAQADALWKQHRAELEQLLRAVGKNDR
jgi:uncharacterized membrane protein (UPF0182 family)